jgi:hypothetical protein
LHSSYTDKHVNHHTDVDLISLTKYVGRIFVDGKLRGACAVVSPQITTVASTAHVVITAAHNISSTRTDVTTITILLGQIHYTATRVKYSGSKDVALVFFEALVHLDGLALSSVAPELSDELALVHYPYVIDEELGMLSNVPSVDRGDLVLRHSDGRCFANWASFPYSSGGIVIDVYVQPHKIMGVHLGIVHPGLDCAGNSIFSSLPAPSALLSSSSSGSSTSSSAVDAASGSSSRPRDPSTDSNTSTEFDAQPQAERLSLQKLANTIETRSQLAMFTDSLAIFLRFPITLKTQSFPSFGVDLLYD